MARGQAGGRTDGPLPRGLARVARPVVLEARGLGRALVQHGHLPVKENSAGNTKKKKKKIRFLIKAIVKVFFII